MKLTGAVLLMVCGTLSGWLQAQRLQQKRLICRELVSLCNDLLAAISFQSDSVVALTDTLLSKRDYRHLRFITSAWIIRRRTVLSPLSREENEAISAFLYSLGKSDLASQQRVINGFGDYMTRCEAAYAERYHHDARLLVCLGFFAAAMLTLILL